MKIYKLGEEVAKAAKEKFDAYYVDDVDKAEDIDLYEKSLKDLENYLIQKNKNKDLDRTVI